MHPQRYVLLSLVASIAWVAQAEPPRDPLLESFEGQWGLPGSSIACSGNEISLRFSDDGEWMDYLLAEPITIPDGSRTSQVRYRVHGVAGNSIRMALEGETRRTEAGELVVWDLVQTHPDVFCWHRTDWPVFACTSPRFRCGSETDALDRQMRSRVAEMLESLATGDFDSAARHFFLPDALGSEDLVRERQRLAESFEVLVRELGHPRYAREFVYTEEGHPPEFVSVTVAPSFWSVDTASDPYYIRLFTTDFAHAGEGYFQVAFHPRGDRTLAATFSLPKAEARRMAEVAGILLREIAPEL
jgi:hypothetical protein